MSTGTRRSLPSLAAPLMAVLLAACSVHAPTLCDVPTIDNATYVGGRVCATCHNTVNEQFRRTIHFRQLHDNGSGISTCESCHGPGSRHVDDPGRHTILAYSHLDPCASTAVCLTCHRGTPLLAWRWNEHMLNGIGCTQCHKSHMSAAPHMLDKGDPDLCFDCHQNKRSEHMLPSHHPVREGKMQCSDCHTMHGSENNNLRELTINDLCARCHAEYQGPFVYEHAPAVEDCTICHAPHGSIADNLLTQHEPFLCLRCHRGHQRDPHESEPTAGAFMTRCTQCHGSIHGSDTPSFEVPGSLIR